MEIKLFEVTDKLLNAVINNKTLIKLMVDAILNDNTSESEKLYILKLMLLDEDTIKTLQADFIFDKNKLKLKVKENFEMYNRLHFLDAENIRVVRTDIFKKNIYINADIKVKKYFKNDKDAEKNSYYYNHEKTNEYPVYKESIIDNYSFIIDDFEIFKNS